MKFQNLKFLYPRWNVATQSAVLHIILPFSLFLPGTVTFLRNLFCKEHFFGNYKQKRYTCRRFISFSFTFRVFLCPTICIWGVLQKALLLSAVGLNSCNRDRLFLKVKMYLNVQKKSSNPSLTTSYPFLTSYPIMIPLKSFFDWYSF